MNSRMHTQINGCGTGKMSSVRKLRKKSDGEILGVGVDIVEISQVRRALSKDAALFLDYLCTPAEQHYARASGMSAKLIAAMVAVKEATLKAIGTGLPRQSWWRQVEFKGWRGTYGNVTLLSEAKKAVKAATGASVLVSVSTTKDMVIALALLLSGIEDRRRRHSYKRGGRSWVS